MSLDIESFKADFLHSKRGQLFNVAPFVDQADQNRLFLTKAENTLRIDPAATFRIKSAYNTTFAEMLRIAHENDINISIDLNDSVGRRRRQNLDGEVIAIASFATAVSNGERVGRRTKSGEEAKPVGLKAWELYLERFVVQKFNRSSISLNGGFGRGMLDFLTQAMRQTGFDLEHLDAVVFDDPAYVVECAQRQFMGAGRVEAKITNYLAHRYNLQAPRPNDKRRLRLARPLEKAPGKLDDDHEQLDPVWT